ncbi:NDP-sugar synthase [Planctomycetota bacterium]
MSSQPAGQPTIVFPMGGKGERMGPIDVPTKALVRLPKAGMTLLEYGVRTWNIDFRRVVLLVPPDYREIENAVAALNLGCEVRCSPDPFQKCGRTKALAGAVENGSIAGDAFFIVHNPDDVVINYPGNFAADVVRRHRENAAAGCLATVVTTDSTVHTFTGFQIGGDRVTGIEHNPVCDKKAHIGITLFEPALAADVVAASHDESSSDFERDMFARLAAEGRLGFFLVPHASWIAVNTPKDLGLFDKKYVPPS